jgi:pantoate--beta-alanine ligase
MITLDQIEPLRAQIAAWRSQGERTAFVPTMGNLHAGHLDLVRRARQLAPRVIVSIFVNPLQFGPTEDLAAYPRTLAADTRLLAQAQADLLFAPSVGEIYPQGQQGQCRVEVPGISEMLCGASRPGHFVGVATVVCKLFNMVQPDVAVFGEKDFQQLLVIRRMVADLCMPVEIVGAPTVREADGLAMSSRNGYLTTQERARAPQLFATLQASAKALAAGMTLAEIEAQAKQRLAAAGFRVDYFSLRRAEDLTLPKHAERHLVILAAAYLGQTRLIDNLCVDG